MNLENQRQLENTLEKLYSLERTYQKVARKPRENSYARDCSRRSVKQLINQLTEEIGWFAMGSKLAAKRAVRIRSERSLAAARERLARLEEHAERAKEELAGSPLIHKLVAMSLQKLISETRGAIAKFEAQPAHSRSELRKA